MRLRLESIERLKTWLDGNRKFNKQGLIVKSMKNRGALELSVNTIVIVVLGITILIVGLAFIDTIREKLFGAADTAFERIGGQLEELNAQKLLTLTPDSASVEAGNSEKIDVIIANLEDVDYTGAFAKVESVNPGDLKCLFADTQASKSKPYDIASGKQVSLVLLAQVSKGSGLGNKVCNIEVSGTGITEPDKEDSLIIDVVK